LFAAMQQAPTDTPQGVCDSEARTFQPEQLRSPLPAPLGALGPALTLVEANIRELVRCELLQMVARTVPPPARFAALAQLHGYGECCADSAIVEVGRLCGRTCHGAVFAQTGEASLRRRPKYGN
jgi:hypothetical protein